MSSLQINDFRLVSPWKVDDRGEKFQTYSDDEIPIPKYIIDESTDRKYLNETEGCIRKKCALLVLGTLSVQSLTSSLNVAYRILKIVTFAHFWLPQENGEYNFKGRLISLGMDLLRVILTPLALLGLLLASIYGIFCPHDGRKIYASLERFLFEDPQLKSTIKWIKTPKIEPSKIATDPIAMQKAIETIQASLKEGETNKMLWKLAPCFQPNPQRHLFGGNINKRDQF